MMILKKYALVLLVLAVFAAGYIAGEAGLFTRQARAAEGAQPVPGSAVGGVEIVEGGALVRSIDAQQGVACYTLRQSNKEIMSCVKIK
jgi:hypothetical protein